MLETMTQFVLADHIGGAAFVPPEGEMGYKRLLSRTRGTYPTQDGYLAVVVYTDKHWRAFSEVVGDPGLVDRDPRFASQEARTRHAEDAGRYLSEHLPTRTTAQWLEILHGLDIPACPVNAIEDLMRDPHLTAVSFFETLEHPTEGAVINPRFPVRFSATPANVRRLAPNLGEHTDEVLGGAAPSS